MNTLPVWVIQFGLSLDGVRKLLRQRPDLRALGKTFGSARLYTDAEADKIRIAYEQKLAARAAKALASA